MEMIVNVRLYGELGAKFGRLHRIAVKSAAEAVKALSYTIPGFRSYLYDSGAQGLAYSVFYSDDNLSLRNLSDPCGRSDIRIAPMVIGSKRAGTFQTIMGVAIIAAAVAAGPVGLGLVTASAAWTIGLSGAVTLMGGLYQMMSKQTNGLMSNTDSANKTSYAFGGPVNSVAMGNPIGLMYGYNEIGGAVLSAGIVAEDQ